MHPTIKPTTAAPWRTGTISTPTLSLQDTVHILREQLGNLRAWHSWLCDGQKRTHRKPVLFGHSLSPCARVNGAPRYSYLDVWGFVRTIQALHPKAKPESAVIEVYDIVPGRAWWANDFKNGIPTFH